LGGLNDPPNQYDFLGLETDAECDELYDDCGDGCRAICDRDERRRCWEKCMQQFADCRKRVKYCEEHPYICALGPIVAIIGGIVWVIIGGVLTPVAA
jgi:hypothetical protein